MSIFKTLYIGTIGLLGLSLAAPTATAHPRHWQGGVWYGPGWHRHHNRVVIVRPAPIYQYGHVRHHAYYRPYAPYYGHNVIIIKKHHPRYHYYR